MSNTLAIWQLGIIRNSMVVRSHKDIATMLGVDISIVSEAAAAIIAETGIQTKQMQLDVAKAAKPVLVRSARVPRPQKKKEPQITTRIIKRDEPGINAGGGTKTRERRLPTLVVDYDACSYIKIDNKTHLVIKPGEDPEKKIAAFKKHYTQYFERKSQFEVRECTNL